MNLKNIIGVKDATGDLKRVEFKKNLWEKNLYN